jgi:hypothetical protein
MKRIWIAAAVLAVTGMTAVAQAQDEYTLQYKHPKAGEAVVLHNVNHVVGTIQGIGFGTVKMTQKTQQWMRIECLEIDDEGTAKIRVAFDRFVMDIDMGGKHVSFDSAEAPSSQPSQEDPTKQNLRKSLGGMFTGKGLTGTVTAEGKCLKMEGIDEFVEGMKDMPGGEQMGKVIKDSMVENVKEQWFGKTSWLPGKAVRIGDIWSSEQRMKMGPMGEVIIKSRNKLLGIETVDGRRIARVGQTVNMEVTPDFAGMKMPGAENMKMKITSQGGKGTWLWDLDKGCVVKMQQNAPMELTMEFGSTTQPSASVKMTQKFNYTTVVETVGDEAANKLLPLEAPKPPAVEPAKSMLDMGTTTQPAAKE